jgi:4-hydroxy-tetrahydrodipicolinate synthase
MRGSLVPLVTPFRDGGIDDHALGDLVDWHVESGSHGVVMCGSTGEGASLSTEEREHVFEVAVRAARRRIPVVAGTGSVNLETTLRLTRFAQAVGADAAMVVVPYYARPTQDGLYRFFRTVADAVDIPIIIYNIPSRAAVSIDVDTTARLARECANIIGQKESSKDIEHHCRLIHRCGARLHVYCGVENVNVPMLAIGAAGQVSSAANVLPAEFARLYDAAAQGRWDEARRLHDLLLPMNDAIYLETNPAPLKSILSWMGRCTAEVRLPLAPVQPETESALRVVASRYGLVGPAVAAVGAATGGSPRP